ncbi:MAG: hypothetical protein K2W96_04320 [Gemmataceae bacterium]|nr:hypothetical protein [Gemmataceae bacterium]
MTSIRMLGAGLLALAALVAAGCGGKEGGKATKDVAKEGKKEADKEGKKKEEEDHSVGPHKGAIAEWGDPEEYHAEFTFDPKTKTAKVYILGKDPKNWTPAPIKTDKVTLSVSKPTVFQIELKPEKQDMDPEGTASVFVGKDDHLAKDAKFEGTLSAKIGDKAFSGDINKPKK